MTLCLLRFKTGVEYVQQDSMAGRMQVPRWGLLRDLRDSLLPVAVPHSNADLWHWLRPDTRARRIPCHCPYRPVLHVLLPRFHSKVERQSANLPVGVKAGGATPKELPREVRLCWRRGMGTVGRGRSLQLGEGWHSNANAVRF